jgi:hypothetical protein
MTTGPSECDHYWLPVDCDVQGRACIYCRAFKHRDRSGAFPEAAQAPDGNREDVAPD